MPNGHRLREIVKALGLAGFPIAGTSFEFEPDSTERTNFDFMIPLDTGNRIYFELKYTETGFGSAKSDHEHLWKFQSIYRRRLAGRFEASFCTANGFLENYQILRNLWHLDLDAGDIAVFLLPKANQSLARSEATIRSCLLQPFRSRVIVVHIEDLISVLGADSDVKCETEDNALSQFRMKYFPTKLPLDERA